MCKHETKAYMKAKHTSIQKLYIFADPMYIFSENGSKNLKTNFQKKTFEVLKYNPIESLYGSCYLYLFCMKNLFIWKWLCIINKNSNKNMILKKKKIEKKIEKCNNTKFSWAIMNSSILNMWYAYNNYNFDKSNEWESCQKPKEKPRGNAFFPVLNLLREDQCA